MKHYLADRGRSFRHAFSGMRHVLRTQPNARLHLLVTAMVVLLGVWLQLPLRDWALIALTITLVLAAEFFNTALEALVDLTSPQPHPLAKIAKDVSAAAVLLSAAGAVILGLLLLGPPLWDRLVNLFSAGG